MDTPNNSRMSIESGGKAVIDGHEGRRSVEIILAIYAAAEAGTAIELPLKSDPVLKAREKDQQA